MSEENKLFAALLKYWRGRRGLSQLDLALTADISARHVSFLETGRSNPSEDMVLLLGATLNLPLREQNEMLRAAGFAPAFDEPPLEALGSPAIERALGRMMKQHEPFPMVVMDRAYDVLRMNKSANQLLASGLPEQDGRINAIRAIFDPEMLRPMMVDWPIAAQELVSRLHRECLHRPQDRRLNALLESLFDYPDVPQSWRRPDFALGNHATFAFRFQIDGMRLSFLTTLMQFSAPQNITLEELQIESYFPLDEQTEALCMALQGDG